MLKFEPFYQEYERTLDAFSLAFSTIYFEQMTIAPKKGIPYSNEMLSRLSKQAFIIENDPETIQKIKEYAKHCQKEVWKRRKSTIVLKP